MGEVRCAVHPDAAASGACQSCLKTICDLCLVIDRSRVLCLSCARSARRTRAVVGVAVAVLAVGGVAVLIARVPKKDAPAAVAADSFAISAAHPELAAVEARLAKEPCDRQQMFTLDQALQRAGDHRALIDRTEAFWQKCGPLPRLRWFTYDAHKKLSELDRAIADATLLIDGNPHDKDFWWWRGVVYEEQGKLEKAAADYRQSMAIEPRITGIPFNLAAVYEKMGQPCDAILPIEQFLRYHPDVEDRESVQQRLLRLYADPSCVALAGTGRAVIRFSPGASTIRAMVKVGSARGNFIVDTGASYTVLGAHMAETLGLPLSSKVLVHTANGIISAKLSVVDAIEVMGARARDVPVAVMDKLPPGVDGLLGLSFLARFNLQMETLAGKLTISAKRR